MLSLSGKAKSVLSRIFTSVKQDRAPRRHKGVAFMYVKRALRPA